MANGPAAEVISNSSCFSAGTDWASPWAVRTSTSKPPTSVKSVLFIVLSSWVTVQTWVRDFSENDFLVQSSRAMWLNPRPGGAESLALRPRDGVDAQLA